MSEGSLFLDFLRKFEQLGLEYMVTGSVASTMYGEPRVTHDVDVVLKLPPGGVAQFAQAFRSVHVARQSSSVTIGLRASSRLLEVRRA